MLDVYTRLWHKCHNGDTNLDQEERDTLEDLLVDEVPAPRLYKLNNETLMEIAMDTGAVL